MRTNSNELIDDIEGLLNLVEKRTVVWQKLGERHCRVMFCEEGGQAEGKERKAETEKDMLFSIVHQPTNDLVIVHCNAEHKLALRVCLALLKKGADVRCFAHNDNEKVKDVIFDTTAINFCQFVKNLQQIADELRLTLCLGSQPLSDYRKGLFFVRLKDLHGTSKLVGVLTQPNNTLRVTILDQSISLPFLVAHFDERCYHLIIRRAVPTDMGRKAVTLYDWYP